MAAALGRSVPQVSEQKASGIEEGQLRPDHVHMIALPAKYAVWQGIGFIKGKSVIQLVRGMGRGRGILWDAMSGHAGTLTTVGRDETVIGEYIRQHEAEDKRLGQINRWR